MPNKMVKMKIKDNGYVIIDTDTNEFYCGMKKFDKQMRKAQIWRKKAKAEECIHEKLWLSKMSKNPNRHLTVKSATITMELE